MAIPLRRIFWRNIIPHVEPHGRCIAPDLIGMGDSDKLPASTEDGRDGRYRFIEQRRYLDAFLDALDVNEDVILAVHDWGSALGFDWARRHPDRVAGIVYMDAMLEPVAFSEMSLIGRVMISLIRSRLGEWIILDHNFFVERMLPGMVLHPLTETEMEHYRAPFRMAGEDRRPTLTWPREVPIGGEPAETHEIVMDYLAWLRDTGDLPKLWIDVSEGALIRGKRRDFAAALPNQQTVRVDGRHFVQEDSPDEIGRAIAEWLQGM